MWVVLWNLTWGTLLPVSRPDDHLDFELAVRICSQLPGKYDQYHQKLIDCKRSLVRILVWVLLFKDVVLDQCLKAF